MNRKRLARSVAHWTIPPGLQDILRSCLLRNGNISDVASQEQADPEKQSILKRNLRFLNKHRGQRCFILATGPSIREYDLRPLQREWCIAVSDFNKHEHYNLIRPAYYAIVPCLAPFTDDDVRKRLTELKQRSQDEIFFFGLSNRKVVETSNLVDDPERVHYLDLSGDFIPSHIDLTVRLPGESAATLMASWVAIYMGFSEIYLVGCDHDKLWRWDGSVPIYQQHFYNGAPTIGHKPFDVDFELRNCLRYREQYRWTHHIAIRQNIRIVNANPKSYIEIFPKISLSALFDG